LHGPLYFVVLYGEEHASLFTSQTLYLMSWQLTNFHTLKVGT